MGWLLVLLVGRLVVQEDTFPAFQELSVVAQSKAQTLDERIAEIDAEIEVLKARKRGYEGRALWFESTANREQFNQEFVLETRRLWMLAEENRMMAAKLQERIDRLEAEKQKLLESR